MKFCQYCGRPLQDNEVCSCQQQSQQPFADRQSNYPTGQPSYPQQPQYPAAQQVPQPYYGQPAKSAVDSKINKTFKRLPEVLKNYWGDSEKVVGSLKKDKEWLLAVLFIPALFIVNLILGICYFARMTSFDYVRGLGMYMGSFYATNTTFQFGFTLLSAIIMTVVALCVYVGFRFLAGLILAKKKPVDAILDAVIEFGINTMPIIPWLFLGALLTLATCWLTVPFVGLAMAYYVVTGVSNTLKECAEVKNTFMRNMVISAFVMLSVALTAWMLFLCCQMNAMSKLVY